MPPSSSARPGGGRTVSPRCFTSESVTEGHPDKIADQISDAVLDAVLADDPRGRVACETLVTTGLALVAGEITSEARVDFPKLVRKTLVDIGYDQAEYGIDGNTCGVLTAIDAQSPEIKASVDRGGAGDQGMMFGFACDETPEKMPAPIAAAHALTRRLAEVRKSKAVPWLRPDGKAQVTFQYAGTKPDCVKTVVLSAQHEPCVTQEQIAQELISKVIRPALSAWFDPDGTTCLVNPSGSFVKGGPQGDAGLTGRKIIVDTYGGMSRHGGGAFSGKDASKVDRSAAYAARWAAKNVVAAGAATRCEIQLAYAIGEENPVQVSVDSFGTGCVPDEALARAVRAVFDFRPRRIIQELRLRDPIFARTAAYGHFGREPSVGPPGLSPGSWGEAANPCGRQIRYFPWERTDRVADLKTVLGC